MLNAQQCESTPVTVGYRTFSYDASDLTGYPTEEKPESKLWWNDGSWWGVLWDPDLAVHRIHRFDLAGQCWTSVGPDVDDRARSSADVLWDASEQKLYMSSRAKENHSGSSDVWFLRFSYDSGTNSFSLDSGFPVSIHGEKTETFVIAKDSNGKFWATWEEDQDIMINRTIGSDDNWGTPFVLPVQGDPVDDDDISSIIAFGGNKIGVMWSNQTQRKMLFAVHHDGDADTTWQPKEEALEDEILGSVADDHINLAKSSLDGGKTILAITKTSLTTVGDPLIILLKRDVNGVWSRHEFGRVEDDHTRPIVLVNSENDSIYVMAKAKTIPVKGYLKRTHMDNPQFSPGLGELFISSGTDDNMNNPTSTKQSVNSLTGLLVLASDKTSKRYLHNYLELPSNVPVIESFTPTIGLVGTEVTVTGPKFFTGTTAVTFNGTPATSFIVDSDTQLRATVPTGAKSGLISLTNAEGTSTTDNPFTVILTPQINSFTPADGPVTSDVTINGNHFIQVSGVSFGVEPAATFTVDSKNQIRAQVASGTQTGPIAVTNPAGTGTSTNSFTVTGVPNILAITPASGLVGSEVTVTGVNFGSTTDVSISGVSAATFTADSDTTLRFEVPAGATTGEITVTNSAGTAQSPDIFVVVLHPAVSSFSPDPGYEGLKITVTGSNFIEIDDVTFGGISATSFTVISETQLRATVPAAAITGPIGVTNTAGTALSSGDLTIIDPPVLKTFAPAHDSRVWSATPTINYGSLSDLRVRETSTSTINTFLKFDVTGLGGTIGSATLRLYVEDATNDGGGIFTVSNNFEGTNTPWTENGLIWDNAPAIAGTPLSSVADAAVGEIVEFDLGASIGADGVYSFGIKNSSSDAVKYQSKEGATPPELVLAVFLSNIPTITSFSPASVPEGGEVTVTGTSFTGTTAIVFNGLPATGFTVDSDTQLRAIVPAGATDGRIHVTNAEGTGISASDLFIISPPTVSAFTPLAGIVGTEVTVNGTNFHYVTQVDFNGTPASTFQIDSETQLRVDVPAGALTGSINVTNPAGTAASSSDFSVLYPPMIASFSPDSGIVGTEVTIMGQSFSGTTAVTFSDSSATFTIISNTEIRALVPTGVSLGKIRVTNADGNDLSSDSFVPILVPAISAVTPADGPETSQVTITGQNFLQIGGVSFNGLADSSFVVDSPTQIRASVPLGATAGPVGVSNPAGTGTSAQDFLVTFVPVIDSFAPIIGVEGTEVTITGLNLAGTQTVSFGAIAAAVVNADSDTQLRTQVPAGVTSGSVSVTNGEGTTESSDVFTVIESPFVSSFSPDSGMPGTEITIAGSNFVQISEVSFNGVSASDLVVDSETQLRATVPLASSTGPISVANPAGVTNSGSDFTFIAPPSIVSFTPIADTFVRSTRPTNNYGDDSELRVRLSSSDYNTYLKFNVTGVAGPIIGATLRLSVIDVSDEGGDIYEVSNEYLGTSTPWQEDGLIWDNAPEITGSPLSSGGAISLGEIVEFDLSAIITGEGIYSFAISNGSSDAAKYDPKEGAIPPELVIEIDSSPVPGISSFAPSTGIIGTEVTLSGTNFIGITDVTFNDSSASSYVVDSDSQIRVDVPPGATTGRITVVNGNGSGQSSEDFTVILAPTVSSFSPVAGEVGTEVTVTGSGFSGTTDVTFDGQSAAAFTLDSDTQLRAEVPANTATGAIGVVNAAGSTASADSFAVLYPPIVTSFSPLLGVSGTEVTISGSKFTGTSEIRVNGTAVSNFIINSDNQVTATIASGTTTGKIAITNTDGTGLSSDDFVVIQPPTVTSFDPPLGPEGTEVTIIGANFTDATEVSFDTVQASVFTIDSDSQIRATVANGTSTGPISVNNVAGTGQSTTNFSVTAPPSVFVFNPLHDSFVRSTEPNKNYGDDDELRVRLSSTDYDTYMKFAVAGLSGTVQSARIRLFVIDGSSSGGDIYQVSNDYSGTSTPWEEMGLVWNNAPAIDGSPLGTLPAVTLGDTVEFDVTSAISGNGTFSFAITSSVSDAAKFSPKEGGVAPKLVVEVLNSPIPSLSSFSPITGPVGTEVTIAGFNFTGTSEVAFNGLPAVSFTVDSDTQLRAEVSSGATTGRISVRNLDGTGDSGSDFTVIDPPVLTSFSPPAGAIGSLVTLSGSAFSGASEVAFNGTVVSNFTIESDSEIRAEVPAGAVTGAISVTNVAGTGVSSSDFVILFVPNVISFTPASGIAGTEITVAGQNFTGTTNVKFDSVAATAFTVDSDSQIRATVPAATTTGAISVTNNDGTGTSNEDFVLITPPSVGSMIPSSGPVGMEVTISGTSFTAATQVSFNGITASVFTVDSDSLIRATVPQGATTGTVSVTNIAGTGLSAADFSVTFIPSISSFTPVEGAAGDEVTLSGVNFTGTTEVAFDSITAGSFTVDSDSVLRADVPIGATTSKISVTNSDGTGQSAENFVVIEPPTLSSFLPSSSPVGTEVTVLGDNLNDVTELLFNGVQATGLTIDSDNQLRATVPSGATSGVLSITNPGGTALSSSGFTVTAPPSQLVFNPTDDSFVRSTEPNKNYGDDDELRARLSSTDYDTYIKFDVSGITGAVISAKVRLFVIDASSQGGDIYTVSNDYEGTNTPWKEMGLIWNNAPAINGTPLSSIGAVTVGDTVDFDVTSAIFGDGVYSFALTNTVSDAAKYDPKEGNIAPRLEIELLMSSIPSLSSFNPPSGVIGTEVTVLGEHFTGTSSVSFNGVAATSFAVDSGGQLRADVPAGATTGPISVTNSDGTGMSTSAFSIISQPAVSSFAPSNGGIGTQVTITGSAFTGVSDVRFNGTSVTSLNIDSDSQIQAQVPSGATTGVISV
ncbi:IPT/TIG domain-containing protein, partial [bacterium]|nr:IPT/TIG domain-containing protein [bacterium]